MRYSLRFGGRIEHRSIVLQIARYVRRRTDRRLRVRYLRRMDWSRAATDWPQFRSEVRARWQHLTDAQLDGIAGQRAGLAEQLRASYGLTADQVERQICRFEETNRSPRAVSGR